MTKQNELFDVLIVGGGMVGASLAVALEPLNLKVGIVEAYEFGVAEQPSYDDRSIALSYGTSRIFSGMGLWDNLSSKTTAIDEIHVSDRGHFGATRLRAEQEKVPALGYLVESRVLGKLLYNELKNSQVTQFVPARVIQIEQTDAFVGVTLDEGKIKEGQINKQAIAAQDKTIQSKKTREEKNNNTITINTRLLVAADGTNSPIREMSGIGVKVSDYEQSAIIANVSTEKPHRNRAYERFTEAGPIALLPMSDNRCSLVWTHSSKSDTNLAVSSDSKVGTNLQDTDRTMALDDKAFLEKLSDEFGHRLGRFIKVGRRSCYPLSLVTSEQNTAKRTVIIGNASHTMHPVAGQGLNLAMRDIAVLADLVAEEVAGQGATEGQCDVGSNRLLQSYESQRKGDLKTTVRYTDSLVRLFSNDNFLLGHVRAGGLLAVDRLPLLRKLLTKQSMGINYRQSRLARGLVLRGKRIQSGEVA